MSTWAYGALTRKREEAEPGTSTTTAAPGLRVWADSLAALVPAEVLMAHAAVLAATTQTTRDAATGNVVTTITSPGVLRIAFVLLVVASALLYVAGHVVPTGIRQWHGADYLRMLIPPLAFVGWTMAQRATAFDAVAPDVGDTARYAVTVVGAVVLAGCAAFLAISASNQVTAAAGRSKPALSSSA
jgi:uncharacterized membrane protein